MRWSRAAGWVVFGVAWWVVVGCSSLPTTPPDNAPAAVGQCRAWFATLDQAVQQHGVRDAQDHRVPGFPQLRASRFTASFRAEPGVVEPAKTPSSTAAFDEWLGLMQALGNQGWRVELANLPDTAVDAMAQPRHAAGDSSREAVAMRLQGCTETLSAFDRTSPERRQTLRLAAEVPDSYSTTARVLGLYAFTRWPFGAGVQNWQAQTQRVFQQRAPVDGASEGPSGAVPRAGIRYVPSPVAVEDSAALALPQAERTPLGLPRLSAPHLQRLLDQHAPIWQLEQRGDFDRIGRLALNAQGRPQLELQPPTVYRRTAWTRMGGHSLLQLVYTVWFSERPKTGAFDLLGGALDGVVWRVTLDPLGQPLVYDSIHACGCYHLFFPSAALRAKPAPQTGVEWAFVPSAAPAWAAGERVVLTLASGTHYLGSVATSGDLVGQGLTSLDDNELRSLPWPTRPGTARKSLFGHNGIVPGTQRGERYFFWPMGVPDAGAQRQWGQHATAFVGRRHFDDADLLDRRFEWLAPPVLKPQAATASTLD